MSNDYSYQLVRVISPITRQPTTVSIEYILFIRACRLLRDVKAVKELVRKLALEYVPGSGTTFSGAVSAALALQVQALEAR